MVGLVERIHGLIGTMQFCRCFARRVKWPAS